MSSILETPEAVEPGRVPESQEVWEQTLLDLSRDVDRHQWQIGDHLNEADEAWGEKYTLAADVTGRPKQTLKNWASVAGKFDSSRRRYDSRLTFGHFEAVASLDLAAQEKLLDKADNKPLSVALLRNEVRLERNRVSVAKPDVDPKDRVVVMVPRRLTSAFAKAAGMHGQPEAEIKTGIAEWLLGLGEQAIAAGHESGNGIGEREVMT